MITLPLIRFDAILKLVLCCCAGAPAEKNGVHVIDYTRICWVEISWGSWDCVGYHQFLKLYLWKSKV